jgi:DNA repair exonuclease SbcCD ATPase subunit/DNA repair exonuclease SbcCD nuclease subunit
LLIAHLSDIHIKNYKYHNQYKFVFNSLYEKLKLLNVDYIFITGDLVHTKTDMSPELVEMSSAFLENLASIAPLHIILGNHDLNLTNKDRQDAITPVVEALKNTNIHLHKYSEKFTLFEHFNFHVLSIVDEENWNLDVEEDKVSIALFHGSVEGSQTDTGFTMTHGDIQFSTLEKFDFALLGDIHKTNQALDHDGRYRYPGSLIQQNHGETNDKGFLIWNIQDKLSFDCQHVLIPNPNPFITVELEENGELPEGVNVPLNARLRLLSRNNLPAEIMKKIGDVAKEKWKPESVSFLSKNVARSKELREVVGGINKEDLRNVKVQEQLIEEFLVNYKVEKEILDKVFEINKKYNTEVEAKEEVARNVNWKIKSIEWDNLFNYGEDNRINFVNLQGIVGIFGKNYSGKSSVIDSILYTLFNTTSKNEKKVSNVINTAKKNAVANLTISVGDSDYVIARSCEKNIKKNGAEETKTELNFLCDGVSMNGNTRVETDQNIKKLFGTMEDFLLTSMSSQLDSLSFIREGSTKRKEILARFLDLEIFDAKNKLAKEESGSLKAIIKKLEAIDYDTEILKFDNELDTIKNSIEYDNNNSSSLNDKLIELRNEISTIEGQLKNSNVELFDIDATIDRKTYLDESLEKAVKQKTEKITLLKEKQNDIKIIKDLLDVAYDDINELKVKKEEKTNFSRELQSLNIELSYILKQERELNNKSNLLTKVPCDTQFPTCIFIKDAVEASNQLILLTEKKTNTTRKITNYSKTIEEYDKLDLDFKLNKYDEHNHKLSNLEKEELQIKIDVEKMNAIISNIKKEMFITEDKIERYKKNEEVFNKATELKVDKTEKEKELKLVEQQTKQVNETITKSHMKIGSLTEKIISLRTQKKELEDYRNQFAAYDYFMKATNSNGISYEIIKKKLPVINEEIAIILSNVVDFNVFFEDDGSKLNINIQHPNGEPRPLEMGSGAEKSIAAMAIRLSLLQVSNLPKSSIFILDEPGTALDSENMEGFIRILNMIKNYYDTVLLISHMDALKDVADQIITIDNKDGFAFITI